jgi:hypothetical protein
MRERAFGSRRAVSYFQDLTDTTKEPEGVDTGKVLLRHR